MKCIFQNQYLIFLGSIFYIDLPFKEPQVHIVSYPRFNRNTWLPSIPESYESLQSRSSEDRKSTAQNLFSERGQNVGAASFLGLVDANSHEEDVRSLSKDDLLDDIIDVDPVSETKDLAVRDISSGISFRDIEADDFEACQIGLDPECPCIILDEEFMLISYSIIV